MAEYAPGTHPDLPPPRGTSGLAGWLRRNLFASPLDTFLTIVGAALIVAIAVPVLQWSVVDAAWWGEAAKVCFDEHGQTIAGACWPLAGTVFKEMMLGDYHTDAAWRIILVLLLGGVCTVWMIVPRAPGKIAISVFMAIVYPFLATIIVFAGLQLEPRALNGFAALLMATIAAGFGALVFGVLLTLGRQSRFPVICWFSACATEIGHAVPMQLAAIATFSITPLVMWDFYRLMPNFYFLVLALAMVLSTYMAEVIRGGLMAVGDTPYAIAKSLGMGRWRTMQSVVLPLALRLAAPGIVSIVAGMVKATTAIMIFSAVPQIRFLNETGLYGFDTSLFVINAAVFFAIGYGLSYYGRRLERRLAADPRVTDAQRRRLLTSPKYADAKQSATSLG